MKSSTTPSSTMRALTVALCVAAVVVFAPLWAPLVVAAWCADLLEVAVRPLERVLGGRRRAAAALVVLLTLAVLVPLSGILLVVASGVRDLLVQVRAALEGKGSLGGVLLGGNGGVVRLDVRDWADLVSRYGANAWGAVQAVVRASTTAALGVLVFLAALYTFVADGRGIYAWLEVHAPIPRESLRRLAGAFRETGRGILVAGGGTALAQGAAATVVYVAIGIPRALLLGPLTALCAIVPFVGTGLVWVPLAVELTLGRQYMRAAVVAFFGIVVHNLIDNALRPALAKHGRLALPTFVVLVSMIGGVAVFGVTGALLGPLVVRLAVEALAITAPPPGEGSKTE